MDKTPICCDNQPMDIHIIGGGITGTLSAFSLAKAGHTVTLTEKHTLGAGASGKALGGLFPYTDNIRTKLAFTQRESITSWPRVAAKLAEASGEPLDTFFRDHDSARSGAKQINVDTFFPMIRKALQSAGVNVIENTYVTTLPSGPTLLAAGWGSLALGGYAMEDLQVQQGQALRVQWDDPIEAPIYGEELYILPTWTKGEVLIGSSKRRMDAPIGDMPDATVTANLLERAGRLVEGIGQAPVLHAWVGYRPTQRPVLPLLRPLSTPQSYAVAGLGGMGYCLAPAVAQAAVKAFAE